MLAICYHICYHYSMEWKLTYYNRNVFEEIEQLPGKLLARYVALSGRMLAVGPDLGMPHTKALGGGLLELRVKGEEGIARVFYCTLVDKEMVILHSFIKKSQAIPKKHIDLARTRLKEVKKYD